VLRALYASAAPSTRAGFGGYESPSLDGFRATFAHAPTGTALRVFASSTLGVPSPQDAEPEGAVAACLARVPVLEELRLHWLDVTSPALWMRPKLSCIVHCML
jgi:hypothetical protein